MLNTVLTASLAMGGAFLLPLFMPEATAQTQMGVVFLLGSLGGETVKQWLFARLRLSVVDLMNPDDINDIRRGMDPETRRRFWEMIYDTAEKGVTVFVTTHYMDEAEYCDRVSVMVDGKIAAMDSPSGLKSEYHAGNMDEVFRIIAGRAAREE